MAESRADERHASPGSTEPPDVPIERVEAARWARRLFFALVCLIVLAGVLGLLGVRTGQARASGGGYDVTVQYPEVTRPGLPVVIDIEVRRDRGFRGPLTVAIASDYLNVFDVSAIDPHAVEVTTTADEVRWQFQTPRDSDVTAISLDAETQTGVELRKVKGSVAILEDGQRLAEARFTTLVMP